jgi:single-strand DNA-binding protein
MNLFELTMIGNVGQDAKIIEVNSRKSINFSLAHNQKYKNAEGVEVEKVTWVGCSLWRNEGQSLEVAKFLTAGTKVLVRGIPSPGSYEKEGKTIPVINLSVAMVQLLSVKEKPADGEAQEEKEPESAASDFAEKEEKYRLKITDRPVSMRPRQPEPVPGPEDDLSF